MATLLFVLTVVFGQALGQSCGAVPSSSDTCSMKSSPKEARHGQQLLQWKDEAFVSRTPQDFYSPAYAASPHTGPATMLGSRAPSSAEAALADLSDRLEQVERREDSSDLGRHRLGGSDNSNHDVRLAAVEARIASMEGGLHAAEDKLQELFTTAQVHSSSRPEVSQAALAPILEAVVQAVSAVRAGGGDFSQREISNVESELASLESRMNRASSPHEVEARIDGLEQRLDTLLGAFGHNSISKFESSEAAMRPVSMAQAPVHQPPVYNLDKEAVTRSMMPVSISPLGATPGSVVPPAPFGYSNLGAAMPSAEIGEEILPDPLRRMGYPGAPNIPPA